MQPTEKEIDAVLDECAEYYETSKFPGTTYEEGVEAAIRWVRGDESTFPMEN